MARAEKHSWMICLALIVAVAAVYWPVQHFEFLMYDDTVYVSMNKQVQLGLSWKQVGWAFTTRDCNMWHPLTWLSLLTDWQLFGKDGGKFHIAPVLFHIGSSVALFLAWRRMTGRLWVSAFAAAAFALHPLRVESVAWVAERKDVTTGFFSMLTLLAYAHYATTPVANAKRRRALYIWTVVAFICGLMCKPMQVTWPAALLLLDYWPLNRLRANPKDKQPLDINWRALKGLIWEKVPLLILAIAAVPVTIWAAGEGSGSMTSLTKIPMIARIENAFVAHLHYLQSFVWPADLAAQYPHPVWWPAWKVIVAIAVFAGLTLFAIVVRKRQPWWLIAWLWMLVTSLPVIGLVQLGAHAFADRYTYIPMIVLPLAVAMTAATIWKSVAWQKPVLLVAGTAAVVALAVCTRGYLWTWQNTRTLFERSLAVTKNNAFAHNNLAAYLLEHNDYDGAIEHALIALQIVPTYPDPHDTLCFAYTQKSSVTDDRELDLKALPEYEKVLGNASAHTQESLSLIHNGYATSLARTGHLLEASEHFRKCTELNPTLPEGHCNLGTSLNSQGRYAEAAAEFREALRLRPDYDAARSMLEKALAQLGERQKNN